ncbi:MAG: cytochrome ubiquinol oxidase subunit I, partial [Kangiellaceae bacterium]|nr:cytochrome ubiquinol oxidase subunit I [Kangiellaceae bacterium]
DMLLFAIPDEEKRTNHFEIAVPKLASIILTHKLDGEVKGLNEFKDNHPPVKPVFFGFRIMVGLGILMLLVSWWAAAKYFIKRPLSKFQLKLIYAMTFSGWVATLAGWYVTEIGRQPYLVQGVLKVSEAVTDLPAENVVFSLTMYCLVYLGILVAYLQTIFYMARKSVEVQEFELNQVSIQQTHTQRQIQLVGETS